MTFSLAWASRYLRTPAVTSALVGASTPEQIRENARAADRLDFDAQELERIESILGD